MLLASQPAQMSCTALTRKLELKRASTTCIAAAPKSRNSLFSSAVGAALALTMVLTHGAQAEEMTLRFKGSSDPAVREAQTRLVQTFGTTSVTTPASDLLKVPRQN